VPGGKNTFHLVDEAVMRALGPQGILVNVARGTVVDEAAMVKCLADGSLGGAALDVFEQEPKVPEVLWTMDNVVLAPHIGSATRETRAAMCKLTIDNLVAHFAGKPLLTPV
jgi:hydroxypyruvate reductase